MEDIIRTTKEEALREINAASNQQNLEAAKVKYLGRKGILANLFKQLASLSGEEKRKVGQILNEMKLAIQQSFDDRKAVLPGSSLGAIKEIDVTLPGIKKDLGRKHPITQTLEEICAIFVGMGFSVVEGPEIETEYYNFQALNIPLDHPSRDAFDTFYLEEEFLLRSHTSPVQVRFMETHKPPFMILVPGKVYRPDATDAAHSFMFHQVEGLAVGENIKFSDLKGALEAFAKEMFGSKTQMRFRPSFFPFTEPSAEVDISCMICAGKGCSVCSQRGWLEILGAGMVDPNVFKYVKYDSEKYTGFAFGMGVERIAMLKHGIDDIRLFYENDLRFLKQF